YKYDIINKNIIETKIKNVDISFLISLDNVSNKYLFFGEIFRNNSYKSGFFILDILENKILDSKILQTNAKSYKPETVVEHCGYFQKAEINSISYTCDKNSKIFIFNGKGLFLNELNTNDNTSLPKVIKNANNECYYSRAGLKFTNAGLFMADNNIYVFSMASKEKDKIIIDQYSKLNMKYIQSFKLNYNNYCSSDIVNVYIKQDMIILKFETNYASFKFSRYI
uniref:hypothetical protein n=1 Tax=Flavobacterium sp. TaxID=239 RepID=UPI003750E524